MERQGWQSDSCGVTVFIGGLIPPYSAARPHPALFTGRSPTVNNTEEWRKRASGPCAPPPLPSAQQVLSLRSRDDAVRATAIEAAAELTARDRTLSLAVEQPATLSALIDLWEGVTDALTGAAL